MSLKQKALTLRGLEVFETLARTGSVADSARHLGMSQPAVSQQLRNLEDGLGAELLNHGKRPMTLTPAGVRFLTRTKEALSQLRQAQTELTALDLSHLADLQLGMIDDFENDVTPQFVTALAQNLSKCQFRLITAPSREILQMLKDRKLDLGIAASTGEPPAEVTEHPLLRDPFLLVAPAAMELPAQIELTALTSLPMIRYERDMIIRRQIDAHLSRLKLDLPARYEIGSQQALMALVAGGLGWAITTPLGYLRAQRFHRDVTVHPLPFTPFARRISLFTQKDWQDAASFDIAATLRVLIDTQIIDAAHKKLPWLGENLRMLPD